MELLSHDHRLMIGKHKGTSLKDVPDHWYIWMLNQDPFVKSEKIYDLKIKQYITAYFKRCADCNNLFRSEDTEKQYCLYCEKTTHSPKAISMKLTIEPEYSGPWQNIKKDGLPPKGIRVFKYTPEVNASQINLALSVCDSDALKHCDPSTWWMLVPELPVPLIIN